MAKIFSGRAFIRVNGQTLISMPGAKLNPGGFERKPVVADVGFVGYTETPVHGEVECDIAVASDTDLIGMMNATMATVTFETGDGRVYLLRDAALAAPPAYESGDSKASLKFIGAAVEQV
ncbi:MAG: phage tail tube protein [Pseudomonadota bacterium]